MSTTRRQFVCGAVGLAVLPLSGCAIAPSVRARVDGDDLRVALTDWPEEARAVIARRDDRKSPVIIVRRGGDEFDAMSSICTHQGCIVRPEADALVCPCHGSVFGLDGEVQRGPAEERLARLETWIDGDELVIASPELPG